MSTPRVTVDDALSVSRVTVTDTAPRVTVEETIQTSGIAVTTTGQNISVVLSATAAGVSSVNGVTGAVTGIATEAYVQSQIATKDNTDEITEGTTNLYFTNARADARVAAGIAAINYPVDSVNGQTNTVVLTTTDIAEGTNQYYTSARANADFDTRLATKTTTNLAEGTNQYFTQARARSAISAAGSLSYDSGTGVISYTTPSTIASLSNHTTTNLAEGTNLYFTNQRAIDAIGGSTITPSRWDSPYSQNSTIKGYVAWALGGTANFSVVNYSNANDLTALTVSGWNTHTQPLQKWTASGNTVASISTGGVLTAGSLSLTTYPTTDVITEGTTNKYYTDARADARVAIGIANLVDSAPATLDTLNELAAALGDDPNYATTITTALGTKLNTADFTSTANTWLATKTTSNLTEGTNLYYTDGRVTTRLNASSINELSDVSTATAAAGQMIYFDGTNWVNSVTVNSANLSRFSRTNDGTAANAIVAISRNRADAARAVDNGPWLGFEYVGTDNTQATSVQNVIRSRYQTSGNHQLQFLQLAGDYSTPTVMGQIQRGSVFFNNTSGGQHLSLTDIAATIRGTTTTITNNANTTTYAQFVSSGHTIGNVDAPVTTIRNSGANTGIRPVQFVRNITTATTTPANNDGTSYRLQVAGSNLTPYNLAQVSASYNSGGDHSLTFDLANGDQNTGTMSSLQTLSSKITETRIRAGTASATPGGSSVADVAIFTPTNTTVKSNAFTLQNNAGTALTSAAVSYTRTYGEFAYTAGSIVPVAADTVYELPLDTTNANSGVTISNTSRININVAGFYKIIISLQVKNADNANDHLLRFWIKKNGTSVTNSATLVTPLKLQEQVISMDWLVESDGNDYWEVAYYVNDTDVTFPNYAAITSPVTAPSAPPFIVNVIPAGM